MLIYARLGENGDDWEPEPYELPLVLPVPHPTRAPGYDDDAESESSTGVIVIDLA